MKLYIFVQVFQGVVDDVSLFLSFDEAEKAWQKWTEFKGNYGDHLADEPLYHDFNEDYDESKIFEVKFKGPCIN